MSPSNDARQAADAANADVRLLPTLRTARIAMRWSPRRARRADGQESQASFARRWPNITRMVEGRLRNPHRRKRGPECT
jgi:hypothetical protein